MTEIGYFLSSEEHGPAALTRFAQMGEGAGFRSVLISDHFHPWLDRQGESPFVWSVIGAIAATTRLHVTTGVTCPTVRMHPAIVAHASVPSRSAGVRTRQPRAARLTRSGRRPGCPGN